MTSGGIVVAGCVSDARTGTIGRVVEANGILSKRGRTGGRIVAVLVARERVSAVGGVVVASCVFRDRVRTDSTIAALRGAVRNCRGTVGCVVVAGLVGP